MAARAREAKDVEDANTLDARAVVDRMKATVRVKTDIDLAGACGVSIQTLNSWKKRDGIPLRTLIRFARAWHVSLDWLVFGAEPEAATKATDEVLKRVAEAVTNNPGPSADERNARMQTLFRARPEIMAILTQSGAFSEAQISAMVADTGAMTVQILAEVAETFDLPLDVLVYGKAGSDYTALVYSIGFALNRVTHGLMPEFAGVRLFEEGEEPHLRIKSAQHAWHMAVVHHLAGVVEHFYDHCLQQRLADPEAGFGR